MRVRDVTLLLAIEVREPCIRTKFGFPTKRVASSMRSSGPTRWASITWTASPTALAGVPWTWSELADLTVRLDYVSEGTTDDSSSAWTPSASKSWS